MPQADLTGLADQLALLTAQLRLIHPTPDVGTLICSGALRLLQATATTRWSNEGADRVDFQQMAEATLTFVRANQHWAPLIIFVLAFGETLVVISVFIPSTAILVPMGLLLGATGTISPWTMLLAGGVGASLGFSVSYLLGVYFKRDIIKMWPFRSYPDLIPKAEEVFARYGVFGVLMGHLLGPVRPLVPIVAGISHMGVTPFMAANIPGAFLWVSVFFLTPYYAANNPIMQGWLARLGIS